MVLLGVTQEQHPNRCRLLAQWHNFDWPILHDPINVLRPIAVPIVVAIDEHGIVRQVGPDLKTFENDFLNKNFPAPTKDGLADSATVPDLSSLVIEAKQFNRADAWRNVGDANVLWRQNKGIDQALDAYGRAVALDAKDGNAHFRLGVVYRMRYESEKRVDGDFQRAIDQWSRALNLAPNQYIWRRRIQQFGPRLDKPYSFYDWVSQAQDDIRGRGEVPVALAVEPSGAELAHPSKSFPGSASGEKSPDARGQIARDSLGLIALEVTTVPGTIEPGKSARIHITFRPNQSRQAHWNNESDPLRLWVDLPDGWQIEKQLFSAPQGKEPETTETRTIEFEVRAPKDAKGAVELKAYSLYYVCESAGGTCLFLRKDINVPLSVGR